MNGSQFNTLRPQQHFIRIILEKGPYRFQSQCLLKYRTAATFAVGLCFYDFTDATRTNCILGREGELVPGTTLEVFQPIGALTGTDGEVTPLFAVILRVLQDVA